VIAVRRARSNRGMTDYRNLLAVTGLDPDLNLVQGIVGFVGMAALLLYAIRHRAANRCLGGQKIIL
jgi:hypothetical protein